MAGTRDGEFEASFGARTTRAPLEPRLRDRHAGDSGSVSELVDTVASRRTIGDTADATPRSRRQPVIPADSADTAAGSVGDGPDPTPVRNTAARPAGTRWWRLRRRLVAFVGAVVLALVAYFLVTLFQVWSTGRSDDAGPVDAIVVMGAAQYDGRPSPQLAARLDHVVEIWPDGVAPLVVVTGGNIPGDRFTEAEASAAYLVERGIPADAILMEDTGASSQESLDSVAAMLTGRGASEVLIVTDPYHALRSRLIADELGLDASVSSTDTSVVTGFDNVVRHVEEAGGVAIGRVIGFDRLARLVD